MEVEAGLRRRRARGKRLRTALGGRVGLELACANVCLCFTLPVLSIRKGWRRDRVVHLATLEGPVSHNDVHMDVWT